MISNKEYLGGAVYIEFDGHDYILTTDNGIDILNQIILDPITVEKLIKYIKKIKEGEEVK